MLVAEALLNDHEVVSARELRRRGLTDRGRRDAVRSGRMLRLRRDRFASPELDSGTRIAVSAGARLGCVSELRRQGIWVTADPARVHAQVAPGASRLRDPASVELHWSQASAGGDLGRVAIIDALHCSMLCQSPHDAVASIDSALQRRVVRLHELARCSQDSARRGLLDRVDARAESGLESLVRLSLIDLGLRVEPQVSVRGLGRVDLVVEGAVSVETDGAAFHSGPRRHVDHQRDAIASAAGLIPLRFGSQQVLGERPAVIRAVLGALRTHGRVSFSARDELRAIQRAERGIRS
jgi:very-short-patch-repair endonuclease